MVNASSFQNVEKIRDDKGHEIAVASIKDRIGFTGGEGRTKWWGFTLETWARTLGANEVRALQLGKDRGWLRHEEGRDTAKVRVGTERPRMYVVTWEIFGDDDRHPALWDRPVARKSTTEEPSSEDESGVPF
jgi:hypothetical protein